jgi:hypothetical protein
MLNLQAYRWSAAAFGGRFLIAHMISPCEVGGLDADQSLATLEFAASGILLRCST